MFLSLRHDRQLHQNKTKAQSSFGMFGPWISHSQHSGCNQLWLAHLPRLVRSMFWLAACFTTLHSDVSQTVQTQTVWNIWRNVCVCDRRSCDVCTLTHLLWSHNVFYLSFMVQSGDTNLFALTWRFKSIHSLLFPDILRVEDVNIMRRWWPDDLMMMMS